MGSKAVKFLGIFAAMLIAAGAALADTGGLDDPNLPPPSPEALKAAIVSLNQKGIRTPLKAERDCLRIQRKAVKTTAKVEALERRAAFASSAIQARKAALEALKSDPNISQKDLRKIDKRIERLNEELAKNAAQLEKLKALLLSKSNLEKSKLNARTASAVLRLEEKKAKLIALAQSLVLAFPDQVGYAEALAAAQALDFSQSGFVCQ